MAAGCSVVDLMRILISIMILATQFVIPAQAATETGVQNVTSTSDQLPETGVQNVTSTSDQLPKVQRSLFPKDFVFGTSSSAYQVEGAATEGGKGYSIWDTYSYTEGKIKDKTTGDTAIDQYHRFREDIWLMKVLGMDAYRFSIAWSRILPNGTGTVNMEGVNYYNSLIDALLEHDIQPYVTLFHWDVPQTLEDSLGGWLNATIVDAYAEFARLSFRMYGDRVKHWITFNEVHQFVVQGYGSGTFAPGRCSSRENCIAGNSLTEPYIVAHNCLNAHAEAVRIYRSEFQKHQHGVIGMSADSMWYEPLQEDDDRHRNASKRAMEFNLGWFMDPIFFGDYPEIMHLVLGTRLPQFTAEEKDRIKGSCDFVGYNHYTSKYATVDESSASNDNRVTLTPYRNGTLIGPQAGSDWLHAVPYGMRKSLAWIRDRYNNPMVYITENGCDEENIDDKKSLIEQLNDQKRIAYHREYLQQLLIAISEGSNVTSYFVWSFADNFEWSAGYTVRFGIYYVDYKNNLARYAKASALWFRDMLSKPAPHCEDAT